MIRENVMLVIVKSMKSPRSALCKTSIMASTDIFQSFGYLLPSISEDACAFDHLVQVQSSFCIYLLIYVDMFYEHLIN